MQVSPSTNVHTHTRETHTETHTSLILITAWKKNVQADIAQLLDRDILIKKPAQLINHLYWEHLYAFDSRKQM